MKKSNPQKMKKGEFKNMEFLFNKKMPSKFANQLNGKSAQENYNEILRNRQEQFGSLLLDPIQEKEIEK